MVEVHRRHFLISKHGGGLHVFIMSRTRFRVSLHSIIARMSRDSMLKAGVKSEI